MIRYNERKIIYPVINSDEDIFINIKEWMNELMNECTMGIRI